MPRLPVGAAVRYTNDRGECFDADLLDLSREGCRLASSHLHKTGAPLSVEFPPELAGGQELSLPGHVLRENPASGSDRHLVTITFGDLDPDALALLRARGLA